MKVCRAFPYSLLVLIGVPLSAAATNLPVCGPIVPELHVVNDAVLNFMTTHRFEAGTLALMRDSRLVLRQGYGWRDANKASPTHPDNLFRLASVSKVPTASAIKTLIREGKIAGDTRIYGFLGIAPWRGTLGDPRISDVTVQMLLDHTAGWDANISPIGNIIDRTVQISTDMGLNHPATASEVIRWVFSKPLDFTPGTRSQYSNFGYTVLARVIEKASGKSFIEYLSSELLGPLGIRLIQSRSRPSDRDPWEIWYSDRLPMVRTAVDFPAQTLVKVVDGGTYYEALDAAGGLTGSAPALCRYLLNYLETGDRRDLASNLVWEYTSYGAAPATTTVLYQKIQQSRGTIAGLEFAALFNERNQTGDDGGDARAAILGAVQTLVSPQSEAAGKIQWASDTTEVSKRAGSVTLVVLRSGGTTTEASASYTTYSKTADVLDYTTTSGVLTFAAGETVKSIIVPILDNTRISAAREFSLELISAGGGASLGERVSSTVRILNNAGSPGIRLVNTSTRVSVGVGENVLITGVVLSGVGAKSYLVRGIGPGLERFGVTGFLARPSLTVMDGGGRIVAVNSGWDAALASTFTAVGAFPLASGSADAALIVTLEAGSYTFQIAGAANTTGVGIAEIYELP